ncbi:MAG TPA: hypothetical protein VJ842_18245 [Pyrinomonadaceae bacterium]|nr:hypothetical protein [Pyrinomonadaceae bacterium]
MIRNYARRLLVKPLPPCNSIATLSSATLDRKLSFAERILLDLHLRFCQTCARYREQLILLRAIVRSRTVETQDTPVTSSTPDVRLDAQARARLKRALASRQEAKE